jgi:hypothetical protein
MKKISMIVLFGAMAFSSQAQREKNDDEEEKKGGFKKENLFTGGGVTLSFSNYTTVLGASPVFGYSINRFIDAGVLFNYNYSATRHVVYQSGYTYYVSDDKLKQTTLGPGAFVKVYPIKFLFLQAQVEENYIKQKFTPADGSPTQTYKVNAGSFLVGGGYCSGRQGVGNLFYYVSILFDVAKNPNSPYVEQTSTGSVNVLPIVSAGLQIPLFQKGRNGGEDSGSGNRRRRSRFD